MTDKDREKNAFEDFINSLESLKHLPEPPKPPEPKEPEETEDWERDYFLSLVERYELPKNKLLIGLFINAIKKAEELSNISLPEMIAVYVQFLLWDTHVRNKKKPLNAIVTGFWYGYAFARLVKLDDD